MNITDLKKLFFTFRNGILADTLRKSGYPHKIIYGLNIPQISSIARDLIHIQSLGDPSTSESLETCNTKRDQDRNSQYLSTLAKELWNEREVRESRLLATYLFNKENVSETFACKLAGDVRTPEEADMLAFCLFRHLPFAKSLLETLEKDSSSPYGLCASSLRRHLE